MVPESYFMEYCRVITRQPAEMLELIERLLNFYENRTYVMPASRRSGEQEREVALVSEKTWRVWESQCKPHVEKSCVIDPPQIDMYFERPGAPSVGNHLLISVQCRSLPVLTIVYPCNAERHCTREVGVRAVNQPGRRLPYRAE